MLDELILAVLQRGGRFWNALRRSRLFELVLSGVLTAEVAGLMVWLMPYEMVLKQKLLRALNRNIRLQRALEFWTPAAVAVTAVSWLSDLVSLHGSATPGWSKRFCLTVPEWTQCTSFTRAGMGTAK